MDPTDDPIDLPRTLALNAWSRGVQGVAGPLREDLDDWLLEPMPELIHRRLWSRKRANLRDWRHPDVGWGLILPMNDDLAQDELATPVDAPKSIQRLWCRRGEPPLLRYVHKGDRYPDYVIKFTRGSTKRPHFDINRTPIGLGPDQMPYYLLIYGEPTKVPWGLQLALNANRAVGRLDLTEEDGLGNYVDHLLNEWDGAGADPCSAVGWSVDHGGGPDDITWLMATVIGAKVHASIDGDRSIKQKPFLRGVNANFGMLLEALNRDKPALVVTTSHGAVEADAPVNDRRATLGHLLDQDWKRLDPGLVLDAWKPDGAIWYAHACCSAGADSVNRYKDLFRAGCDADIALDAAAALGGLVASLPRRLLGAEKPLRAFVGQVDPTFAWSIRERNTGQHLGAELHESLYDRFYRARPVPIGLAMRPCFRPVAGLYERYMAGLRWIRDHPDDTSAPILDRRLMAEDLLSIVILGDPTVARPKSRR